MEEHGFNVTEIENFILETNFGIIPKDLWIFLKSEKKNPFDGYSPEEARKIKRKFRKLKRKLYIQKWQSATSMWRSIDSLLREAEEIWATQPMGKAA